MAALLLTALMASQPGLSVRWTFFWHRNEVRGCYERQLVRNPRLEARITLQLVFDGTGHVIDASADGPDGELKQCIVAAARRWSVPVSRHESMIVSYPLVLKPAEDADERERLHTEARACWDWALYLGAPDQAAAHVTRQTESDGFEVVSVEETTLPYAAALCLGRVASRHLVADQWFWFHAQ